LLARAVDISDNEFLGLSGFPGDGVVTVLVLVLSQTGCREKW
jgi:hypothetical protein